MNITIRKLDPQDVAVFQQEIRLFETVFEMKQFNMPPAEHLQSLLQRPHFMAFVALVQDQVVGGLTAYVLDQYYSERPLAYIYDLAVANAYQRKGIGSQLLVALNAWCRSHNFEEVFVQADEVDDYALDFYRSTRPTEEEKVRHFYYTL